MYSHLTDVETEAIKTLYSRIKGKFKVKKIILFGSKARGDYEEYSDIDLLVLTEKPRTFDERWELSDISADISIDYGIALSCLYYNINDWETSDNINPLLKENIKREGIEIVLQ